MTAETGKPFDLIALGEPLLRLSPPGKCQLRRAASLDIHPAGAQFNVACNLARLGKRAALLTKLPDNPLGDLMLDACRANGLDASLIKRVPKGKMGVTYVEFSASPRAPIAVFDRAGSAASGMQPTDYDWDELMSRTRCAYTDGIFPGLAPNCFEAALAFLSAARRNGCLICFDVNYREHLWTPREARDAWRKLLPHVDVMVTNRGVSEGVFGYQGSDESLMRRFADEFGCRAVTFTHREIHNLDHGAWIAQVWAEGKLHAGRRMEFDIVDRYGTGDAYFAGFIYGYLERDAAFGVDFGTAMCALAHTLMGDVAHLKPEDVLAIMGENVDLRVKR